MKLAVLQAVLVPMVIATVLVQFPYVHNIAVTNMQMIGHKTLVVRGTLDIDYSHPEVYDRGNFEWFNAWWQDQVGRRFGPVRLLAITWTLLEEGETSAKLGFVLVLEL